MKPPVVDTIPWDVQVTEEESFETLIRQWQPMVRRPRRLPPMVIDLHGMTAEQAFQQVSDAIRDGKLNHMRQLTVITGRSGVLYKDFPTWFPTASPVGNCGAYTVRLFD